jgi:twitching motility protein PilT
METIATALTAAETGHLILTTLHTPSAPQAIDRIIDVFPPYQQQQVRIQLSTVLEGVIYQTLIPMLDGVGRVPAVEVMLATDAIRNLIREARTAQMWSTMQTSSRYGMQTIDQALMLLSYNRVISLQDALRRCREPESAKKSLARNA